MASVTQYAFQGPKRGADRAVLLAHGAGADMNAAALTVVADALAKAKVPSLRFNFPYMSKGRGGPDRPPVLLAAVREAAAELAKQAKVAPDRIVLGGRSMGGRIASMVAADADDPLPALGLVLLGYPLHPPGAPEKARVEHLPRVRVPTLFVSGTRDSFGSPDELKAAAKKVKGKVSWYWIETGDHGFKPLKAGGSTPAAALTAAAEATVEFVISL
ncbi:MAG: alpha/beta fold hydrolase [Actinomycetota bacterium]|nr:alpha/beta fold hydrolase [Actinomycetota bacterium]